MRSALFEAPSKTTQEAVALPRIYAGSSLQHAMGWPSAQVQPSMVSPPQHCDDLERDPEATERAPRSAENRYGRDLGLGYGNLGSVAPINPAHGSTARRNRRVSVSLPHEVRLPMRHSIG
jgi:hypothetical protein